MKTLRRCALLLCLLFLPALAEGGWFTLDRQEALAAALRDQAKAMTADNRADLYGLPADYILSLNALELPERAKALAQPLLIMQGEQDVQVTVVNDFLAWQALLGEREGIRYRLYPELNHLFMTGDTGTIADYDIANQVDDQVSQDIAEWLIEQAGKSN